jgi:transcriptional regulator with XRE-family HTH domain
MPGAVQEPDYTALIAELVTLRDERLRRQPSDRSLACAAGVSPTTIGKRLYHGQFPQDTDSLLRMVRAVGTKVREAGLLQEPDVAKLLDEQQWRRAHRAEARRRADGTHTSVCWPHRARRSWSGCGRGGRWRT